MAKLMVVDDSPDVAHLIAEMLVREGHDVDIAFDGRQAIERVNAGEVFDVILTDLIMPEVDGVGLVNHLNASRNKTPVIVLSGGGVTINSADALSIVEGLVFAVIQKPVRYEELLEKVAEALN